VPAALLGRLRALLEFTKLRREFGLSELGATDLREALLDEELQMTPFGW
jgi:hypothetical protein